MTTTAPFVVPSPFDESSQADCILESADGDKFKTYRIVLALSSPVFRTMFELPQAPSSSSEIPLITVAEDSHTLLALLRMIYPPEDSDDISVDFNSLAKLYHAHLKYDISLTRMLAIARGVFNRPDLLQEQGLEAYALAWRLGLKSEVKIASRYTHGINLHDSAVLNRLVQLSGSFDALSSLLELRKSRDVMVRTIITTMNLGDTLCWNHGGCGNILGTPWQWYKGWDVNRDRALKIIEEKANTAFQVPYPICNDLLAFLGLAEGVPNGPSPCYATKKCFAGTLEFAAPITLARAFPQEITRLPDSATL